jgi:hypothetical protein
MEKITAESINKVCKVSVHTMVLMPALKEYTQIKIIVMETVSQNGTPQVEKTNLSRTMATRNNLNEAPMIRDTRKKKAPVRYETMPNRFSRYL